MSSLKLSANGSLVEAPQLEGWEHVLSGKVRELYVLKGSSLKTAKEVLVLATDRISAYDFSLQPGIPDKGKILTQMSLLWFDLLSDVVENHVISSEDVPAAVQGRALRCMGLDMIALECVVRGYLTGSGLVDYQNLGEVGGHKLPAGLVDGAKLPEPIFTPATKAEQGEHDENITVAQAKELLGAELVAELEAKTLEVYATAHSFAKERGIILADTKLEFGYCRTNGSLILGDEVLTPDSSRFWDAASYRVGQSQASFDKQFVRDWLVKESGWDKNSGVQPPTLPEHIVEATRNKYIEAFERLSGKSF